MFTLTMHKPQYPALGQDLSVDTQEGAIPNGTSQISYRLVYGTNDLYDIKYIGTGKAVKVRAIVLPLILAEAEAKRMKIVELA